MLLANMEMEWNEAEPERREYDASLGHIEQGIRLSRLIGYDFAVAHFLLTRGRLHMQQGRTEDARAAWQEALAVSHSIQNSWLVNRLNGLLADAG
jgi:tetratricopeptide (TPR) repeat protein